MAYHLEAQRRQRVHERKRQALENLKLQKLARMVGFSSIISFFALIFIAKFNRVGKEPNFGRKISLQSARHFRDNVGSKLLLKGQECTFDMMNAFPRQNNITYKKREITSVYEML